MDDNSQANGFIDNKNRTDRSKQERIQRPAKQSTDQKKKKKKMVWPAKITRPPAAPWVHLDDSPPHQVTPVASSDSMPELVSSSISFQSRTESSTSSMASSSTPSEDMFIQVDPPDTECQSESSRSSGAESDPKVAAPRGQCGRTVARMLDAVQVVCAAGRCEVLPPRPVRIDGSDWMNISGLGVDHSNPNWN